jgi:hypothetical protein
MLPEAVKKSLEILATHRALFGGKRPMSEKDAARVVEIFEKVGAKWVLVGAHAIGLITEPRATVDFDFIVQASKLKAVLKALRDEFGDLDEQDIDAAVRLRAIDVDLIRSDNHTIFKRALDQVQRVGDWNVPRPEVVLALKFLSAVNPWRTRSKRAHDLADLTAVYVEVGRENLDESLLKELSSLVYPGAEREFHALLDKIDRGDPIEI